MAYFLTLPLLVLKKPTPYLKQISTQFQRPAEYPSLVLMTTQQSANWQHALSNAFTNLAQLCAHLELNPQQLGYETFTSEQFPLRVPLSFANCMRKSDPNDPLLRQVLPISAELLQYPGYSNDPVGDVNASASIGVIHKYHGRVLFITTGSCAINCRYCFRRNFPYAELQLTKSQQRAAIAYLEQHTELTEVILSGGDPLLLNDDRLKDLLTQINALPHIQRIRIHTRIPIVLPERMTAELLAAFRQSTQKIIVVIHANHANELSEHVASATHRLSQQGITLLNQSVLLKGINDDAQALQALSERLFAIGVLPYYLHTLDKASGTGHFEVAEADALYLHSHLQKVLPGYLVPRLVHEQAGAAHKILLHS